MMIDNSQPQPTAKKAHSYVSKPAPVSPARARPLCPICGKVSYSPTGEHPQCTVARNDAEGKEERLAVAAIAQAKRVTTRRLREDQQRRQSELMRRAKEKTA